MKKIFIILLLSSFSQGLIAQSFNIISTQSTCSRYMCTDGTISVNILNTGILPGFKIELFGADGFYRNNCPFIVGAASIGTAVFNNIPPGSYSIKVQLVLNLSCDVIPVPQFANQNVSQCTYNCPPPYTTRIVNETFPGCGDGAAFFSNGDDRFNLSPGTYSFIIPYACECGSLDYPFSNIVIGSDPPSNIGLALSGTGAVTGNANILSRIDLSLSGLFNLHHFAVDVVSNTTHQTVTSGITYSNFMSFSDLPPDSYAVNVYEYRTNAQGGASSCYGFKSDTVIVPPPSNNFYTAGITPVNITTNGCGNGKINIDVPNVNNNYYLSYWNDPWLARYSAYLYDTAWNNVASVNGFQNLSLTGIQPGLYNLVVNGQRYDDQHTLTPVISRNIALTQLPCNLNLQTSSTNPAYFNCNDGTITASMQNYTDDCSPHILVYDSSNTLIDQWAPANGSLPHTFTDLVAGTYRVEAYAGSCIDFDTVVIGNGQCDIEFDVSVNQGIQGCNSNQMVATYFGNVCGDIMFTYRKITTPFTAGSFHGSESGDDETDSNITPGDYWVIAASGTCRDSILVTVTDLPCSIAVTATAGYNGTCSGKISGTVTGFCNNVTVELRNASTNVLIKSTVTNSGAYVFDTLNNGAYKIKVFNASGCSDSTYATISGLSCVAPVNRVGTPISKTKAVLTWNINPCAIGYVIQYRILGSATWTSTTVSANIGTKTITGLQAGKTYEWHIRSKCTPTYLSAYSTPIDQLATPPSLFAKRSKNKNVNALTTKKQEPSFAVTEYPNPTNSMAYLVINTPKAGIYNISIADLGGKKLQQKQINTMAGDNKLNLDISSYANGVYMILVTDSKGNRKTLKLIKE